MNENLPVIYICGKVTGLPDLNKPKFAAATRELRGRGYIVRNPLEIFDGMPEQDWAGCMRKCIKALMDCDSLVMLDDWQDSRGATVEVALARQMGMDTLLYTDFLLLSNILKSA